jgi:hypothetical protein
LLGKMLFVRFVHYRVRFLECGDTQKLYHDNGVPGKRPRGRVKPGHAFRVDLVEE